MGACASTAKGGVNPLIAEDQVKVLQQQISQLQNELKMCKQHNAQLLDDLEICKKQNAQSQRALQSGSPHMAEATSSLKKTIGQIALADDAKAVASVAAYARSPSGSLADLPLSLVACRVSRGANEAAFETLHADGLFLHPIVFVSGEQGLSMLLGTGTVLERLLRLGYEERWIAKKLADGERFRLALFPSRGYIIPATWDGVFTTVRQAFPEVAAKVLACESELRRLSFDDIQRSATAGYLHGATYFEVNEAAVGGVSADCRFIDTHRLASDECEGSVEQVRGWLYHKVGLNDLFDGGGLTKLADGSSGIPEYLFVNRRVEEFGDAFAWFDMNVGEI